MIDLRFNDLPRYLQCEHGCYEVETSFRTWIEFDRVLRECGYCWRGIFIDEQPTCDCWQSAAIEFLISKNATPNHTSASDERALDYILDGEYITASFQYAYGIDLTSTEMHWHRFKALLNGLPDDAKISQIVSFRCYKTPPKNETTDDRMRKRKREWALPNPEDDAEREALLAWADDFLP